MVYRMTASETQMASYCEAFADLTDSIIVVDLSGRIIDANAEAERAYGWTKAELVGESLAMLVSPERRAPIDDLLQRCARGEVLRNIETVRHVKSGCERFELLTLSLLTNADGIPIAVASIAKDITDLKRTTERLRRAERQARNAAAQLQRSNEKLKEFVRICSHDLHAPIRSIAGFADLLRQDYGGKLDATADEYIDFMIEGVHRMQTLLDGLLEYARADSEHLTLEQVDCEVVLEDVLANLEADIVQAGATVTHDPLPTIEADTLRMLQLLQNLIENAVKYRSDSPPRIHVAACRRDDDWLFSVDDNGIGIKREKLDEVFEPFRRLHSAGETEGTGLGLALCQRIVQRLGGRIWAESNPAEGSTFLFTIPIARDNCTETQGS